MEKKIRIISLMIILLMISSIGLAQEAPKVNSSQGFSKLERSNSLLFKNESKISEVQVSISDEFNFLSLQIECTLTAGELLVEILNPKGEIKGNYTVINNSVITKGKNTESKETVNGQMDKRFRNPKVGDWIVRVKPKNATGTVKISSNLIFHPKADYMEWEQIRRDTRPNNK